MPGETDTITRVTYAERWFSHKREPRGPLTEEEARAQHESGKLYVAVLGDPESPYAYVEVRLEAGYVGVVFLEEERREYMDYVFAREPGSTGDLFLEQVTRREYANGDELVFGEAYFFKPDGSVRAEKKDYVKNEVETFELQEEVSQNWEPVPEFGHYDSIARLERG